MVWTVPEKGTSPISMAEDIIIMDFLDAAFKKFGKNSAAYIRSKTLHLLAQLRAKFLVFVSALAQVSGRLFALHLSQPSLTLFSVLLHLFHLFLRQPVPKAKYLLSSRAESKPVVEGL